MSLNGAGRTLDTKSFNIGGLNRQPIERKNRSHSDEH